MTRRAPKLDNNHTEIANAFSGLGCSVQSLAGCAHGVPDLLIGITVGSRRLNLLVEIKSHPAGTVAGEPNEEQQAWHRDWRGQVAVVRSLEDVGRLVHSAQIDLRLVAALAEQDDAGDYPLSRGD